VATKQGLLRLISVQLEGEAEMLGEKFATLYGLEYKILGGEH